MAKAYGKRTRKAAVAVPRGGGGGSASPPAGPAATMAMAASTGSGATTYDTRSELWKAEFEDRRGEEITFRDGQSLEVGARLTNPEYRVGTGKKQPHSTVGSYFPQGLDSVDFDEVENDSEAGVIYVADGEGNVAAYDYQAESVSDMDGSTSPNVNTAAAVLCGDRILAGASGGDPVADQYAQAFDAYRADRSTANLMRAADAHYAFRRQSGRALSFGEARMAAAASSHLQKKNTLEEEAPEADNDLGLAAERGFTDDHRRMASAFGAQAFDDTSELEESDTQRVPAPSDMYRMTETHRKMAETLGDDVNYTGVKSYALGGDPGVGKNFFLEQLSAVEGRPHMEMTFNAGTEPDELFGVVTVKDGATHFEEGHLLGPLQKGYRVVINEPNTLPPESLTALYDVVGSRGTSNRWVTVPSPERKEGMDVKIHPETEVVFTYNPEGTSSQRLPAALSERIMDYDMGRPSVEERAAFIKAYTNDRLAAGGSDGRISDKDAERISSFTDEVRNYVANGEPGFEDRPHSRWASQAGVRWMNGARHSPQKAKERLLDHCAPLLDRSFDGEEDFKAARAKLSDTYDRKFGLGGDG